MENASAHIRQPDFYRRSTFAGFPSYPASAPQAVDADAGCVAWRSHDPARLRRQSRQRVMVAFLAVRTFGRRPPAERASSSLFRTADVLPLSDLPEGSQCAKLRAAIQSENGYRTDDSYGGSGCNAGEGLNDTKGAAEHSRLRRRSASASARQRSAAAPYVPKYRNPDARAMIAPSKRPWLGLLLCGRRERCRSMGLSAITGAIGVHGGVALGGGAATRQGVPDVRNGWGCHAA